MKIGNLTSSQGKVSPLVAVGTIVSSVWSTTLVVISGTKQSNKSGNNHFMKNFSSLLPFQGLANAMARELRNIELKTNTVIQVA